MPYPLKVLGSNLFFEGTLFSQRNSDPAIRSHRKAVSVAQLPRHSCAASNTSRADSRTRAAMIMKHREQIESNVPSTFLRWGYGSNASIGLSVQSCGWVMSSIVRVYSAKSNHLFWKFPSFSTFSGGYSVP